MPGPRGATAADTDEKAPLAHHWGPAGAPRSGRHCRRRRHCQSKELIPCTMSSDGKPLEISVKAFLPLSQIPPVNKDNGLTSLLLRYMVFIQNKRELHISSAITWPGWVRYYSVRWMKDRIVWVLNLLHWDIAYLAILNELWSISLRFGDHGRVQTEPLIMNKTTYNLLQIWSAHSHRICHYQCLVYLQNANHANSNFSLFRFYQLMQMGLVTHIVTHQQILPPYEEVAGAHRFAEFNFD